MRQQHIIICGISFLLQGVAYLQFVDHSWRVQDQFSRRKNTLENSPENYDAMQHGFNLGDLFTDSLEETSERRLEVRGNLPNWLSGSLIRNGPAVFGTQEGAKRKRSYNHIFDGLAKLVKFSISEREEGEVLFSQRFLRSRWYEDIVENLKDIPPSITTGNVDPPFNGPQKLYAALTSSSLFDNVPVNVHNLGGGSWVGVTDAPVMLEFDPVTLRTVGKKTYSNSIVNVGGVELFSTAHPHLRKMDDGKLYSFNYFLELRPLGSNVAHIARIDDSGARKVIGSVELGFGVIPYIHDFSMTENYVILCIWPVRVAMDTMVYSDRGFLRELVS